MAVTGDLPRLLSRATVRATGLVAVVLAYGAFETVKGERAYTAYHANTTRIPMVDGMMINVWAGGQLHLIQACLCLWVLLFGALCLLDRSVRLGSAPALAATGAVGLALHFANLPALAWAGIAGAYRIRTAWELDAVPGFLGDDGAAYVSLVSPFMRPRLDPLAWGVPADLAGFLIWGLFAAFWGATLMVSLAALWVGLRGMRGRRPVSAPAAVAPAAAAL